MSNSNSSPTPGTAGSKTPSWLIVVVMLGIVAFAWWQNNHAAQSTTLSTTLIENSQVEPSDLDQDRPEPSGSSVIPDEDAPTEPDVTPEETESTEKETARPNTEAPPPPSTQPRPATSATAKPPVSLRPLNTKPQPGNGAKTETPSERTRSTGPLSGMRTKPNSAPASKEPASKEPVSNEAGKGTADQKRSAEKTESTKPAKSSLVVENQTIRDLNGRIVFKGAIDLKPTLDRIERGEENQHRNDGTSFQNRENRLPRKPAGYYKEYVHPTKGEYGPGPQRVIIGKEGEVWYTPDHYKSFKKIK